jgi:hypothetical protein
MSSHLVQPRFEKPGVPVTRDGTMPPMRRRLLNLVTLLSLLLCAATTGLWVRSYRAVDVVHLASARWYRAVSGGGGVALSSLTYLTRRGDFRSGGYKGGRLVVYTETSQHYRFAWVDRNGNPPPRWSRRTLALYDPRAVQTFAWVPPDALLPHTWAVAQPAGATFDNATYQCEEKWFVGTTAWLPYWLPAALASILPASFAVKVRRRRAARSGSSLCFRCGYDLTANVSGVCPECGTPW